MEDTQTQDVTLKDPQPGTGALTADERGFCTQEMVSYSQGLAKNKDYLDGFKFQTASNY